MVQKRVKSERTRAVLIREATMLFAEEGFEATRLEDVVKKAGMTKGALYHQFTDKRALFEAVLESQVSEVIRAVQRESAARAGFLGVSSKAAERYVVGLEILISQYCEPSTRQILLLDGPTVLGRVRWDELFGAPMRDVIRRAFWAGASRGEVNAELVEPLSHMLYGALREIAFAIGDADDPEDSRAEFTLAAAWVLERLLQRPSNE